MVKKKNDNQNQSPWSIDESELNNDSNTEIKEETTQPKIRVSIKQATKNRQKKQNKPSRDFKNIFDKGQIPNLPNLVCGILLLPLLLLVIWGASGFYKVNTDQQAAELYFGKYARTTNPGLHYILPKPFGEVIKKSVTTINKEEFGFYGDNQENQSKSRTGFFASRRMNLARNIDAESFMLTGDENIVDTDFEVQWRINDLGKFLFNIDSPRITIRKSAESAMREIIGQKPITEALSTGKSEIETSVRKVLQDILDSYNSGIEIVLVQLLRVDPPKQVINAFRDIQTAKADKERKINEAESYKNDIIPRARGEAQKIIMDAEAYKAKVVTDAEGQVNRFLEVYNQYRKSKYVTKKRMYLETMEEVYQEVDKVIIDDKVSKSGLVPYLPINK